jgi:superfamily II DNA or RNA helicase
MYTTQNSGVEGVAGSAAHSPKHNGLHGVQETGATLEASTEAHPAGAFGDGVSSVEDGLSGAIQEMLDGFASPEWKPHGYQERGIEWLTHKISAALFLAPGMGKTSITLAAINVLRKEKLAKRVLILAPLTVCVTTWDSEPRKWKQFQGLKLGLAHGPDKKLVLNDEYYDIVIMNYDGLAWAAPMLAKGHTFDVLVCDELTKLKHSSSKRFKLIKPLLPSFKFKWGLTASPTANGLIDLFGQIFVLDCGSRLGRYITHFRAKYFHQEPWDQYRWYITPEKATDLTNHIADLAMYMDPKDYLALPGLLDVVRPVKLKDMTQYKFLRDEYILKMQDTVITAVNAGVLTNKLRQFTGGALYTEGTTWEEINSDKVDELVELAEELNGEPLIVAYEFNHEAERLLKVFPTAKAIRGGMNTKDVQNIVAQWNAGSIPVLLIQPQAGAHGINLQGGGSAICWFSLTYNLESYMQLIARIYRQGQKSIVRNYLLVAQGTVDEALVQVLSDKTATQDGVFRALKDYATRVKNNSAQ